MPKHCSSIRGSIYNGEKVLKECHGGLRNEVKYKTKSPNTLAYFLGALALKRILGRLKNVTKTREKNAQTLQLYLRKHL